MSEASKALTSLDMEADAVVVDRLKILNEDDPEQVARNQLHQNCNDIILEYVNDQSIYGNSAGTQIFEQVQELKTELRNTQELNERKFALLKNELTQLRWENEGRWLRDDGLAIRRRFLDAYKRDMLNMTRFQGSRAINEGDKAGHHGNAISDAYVFKIDNCMDHTTYTQLYGFSFSQVLRYC
jgi:hypothetical protein